MQAGAAMRGGLQGLEQCLDVTDIAGEVVQDNMVEGFIKLEPLGVGLAEFEPGPGAVA